MNGQRRTITLFLFLVITSVVCGSMAFGFEVRKITTTELQKKTGLTWEADNAFEYDAVFSISGETLYIIQGAVNPVHYVWEYSLLSGAVRRLYPSDRLPFGTTTLRRHTIYQLCLSPSGDRLVFDVRREQDHGIVVITLVSGKAIRLSAPVSPSIDTPLQFTPDGHGLLFKSSKDKMRLIRYEFATGKFETLSWTDHGLRSPDGNAVVQWMRPLGEKTPNGVLLLRPLGDRVHEPSLELYRGPLGPWGYIWAPDGRAVAFTRYDQAGEESEVCLVNVRTKAIKVVGRGVPLDWSRDGRRLLIRENFSGPDPESPWAGRFSVLKVVEGFSRP